MSNFLKNWKLIFFITLLLLYFIFISVVYSQEIKLPSENWSRQIFISEFKVDKINDITNNDNIITIPIPSENIFITFWNHDNLLNYSIIDNDGSIILNKTLNLNTKKINKLNGQLKDNIIYFYSLEGENLKKYLFNWKTSQISLNKKISDSVKDFILEGDTLIYLTEDRLNIIDKNNCKKSIKVLEIEKFEAVEYNNAVHITLVEKNIDGIKILKHIAYDLNSKNIIKNIIKQFPNNPRMSIDHIDIGIVNDNINILVLICDNRFGTSSVYLYNFPTENISKITNSKLKIQGNHPTPYILKDVKDKLTFIAPIEIIKGRETEATNLVLFTVNNGKIQDKKLLTKTNGVSLNPQYFTLNNDSYLQWTDISGRNKILLFSSNNKNIIESSTNLNINEWLDLFMATLTGIIPVCYISLIPLAYIAIPSLFVLVILSFFKLGWMENNSFKAFCIALIPHILAKWSYAKNSVLYNKEIHNFLPIFLKNPLILFFTLTLTTLISIYCLKVYMESKGEKTFFHLYFVFALIDISIFCFLTIPYVYSYLNFTYLVNI